MTLTAAAVRPAEALDELARSIAAAKGSDRLAPVTVVVPTNTCGVMARRALGRRVGIVGVDMVTLNRLAELIAGPGLAASGRSPMSSSLVDLAVARVLEDAPGFVPFGRRAPDHDRRPPAPARRAARSPAPMPPTGWRPRRRGRRRHCASAVPSRPCSRPTGTTRPTSSAKRRGSIAAGAIPPLPPVVLYLPHDLAGLAVEFIRCAGRPRAPCDVVCTSVGDELDDDARDLFGALGVEVPRPGRGARRGRTPGQGRVDHRRRRRGPSRHPRGARRGAVRRGIRTHRRPLAVAAAVRPARRAPPHRSGDPVERASRHGGRRTSRTPPRARPARHRPAWIAAPRLLLARRRCASRRQPTADSWPTAAWERTSRQAGVARDDDWNVRLLPLAAVGALGRVGNLTARVRHRPSIVARPPAPAAAVERVVAMVCRPARRRGSAAPGSSVCRRSSSGRGRPSPRHSIAWATSTGR